MEDNNKTRAVALARAAFEELRSAGISEQYLPILQSVAAEHRAAFFGHFGDEMAICLETSKSSDPFSRVDLSVEIATNRSTWRNRLYQAWKAIRGHDITFRIKLNAQQVTKLKDLLLVLE